MFRLVRAPDQLMAAMTYAYEIRSGYHRVATSVAGLAAVSVSGSMPAASLRGRSERIS